MKPGARPQEREWQHVAAKETYVTVSPSSYFTVTIMLCSSHAWMV
eukprot:COSAG06_NODE_12910_length_1313_cov_1.590610_3_plen_44_part_01